VTCVLQKKRAESETSEGNSSTSSKLDSVIEVEADVKVSCREDDNVLVDVAVSHSRTQNATSDASNTSHPRQLRDAFDSMRHVYPDVVQKELLRPVCKDEDIKWKSLLRNKANVLSLSSDVDNAARSDVTDGASSASPKLPKKMTQSAVSSSVVPYRDQTSVGFSPIVG